MPATILEVDINNQPVKVIDQDAVWSQLRDLPTSQKVRGFLNAAGCEFWDEDCRFVRESSVALAGLGGLPAARSGESEESVAARIGSFLAGSRATMETSAAFSYLNSGNLAPGELYERVAQLGHLSVAHTVTVSLIVAGVSINTEVETSTQRDLVHLSRITVGRTAIQAEPAIVASTEESYKLASAIYDATRKILDGHRPAKPTKDDYELLNNFYPVNKATAFMLTGTLRNFAKLTDQIGDSGKEREYRAMLSKVLAVLQPLWPELFKTPLEQDL